MNKIPFRGVFILFWTFKFYKQIKKERNKMGALTQTAKNTVANTNSGAKAPIVTIRENIEKMLPQIAKVLPKHLTPERVSRIAMTTIQKNPKLAECDIKSLLGAVMAASQVGLEVDDILGQAYLVPFWNSKERRFDAQLQIGYKGFLDLARRSGQVVNIVSQVVYENDEFDFEYGFDEKLKHKPATSNRGKAVYAYAYANLKDGGRVFEVLTLEDIEKARMSSSSQKDFNTKKASATAVGIWAEHYEAMARKTAIRRLAKYLPLSVELLRATSLDEYADNKGIDYSKYIETGVPEDMEIISTQTTSVNEIKAMEIKSPLDQLVGVLGNKGLSEAEAKEFIKGGLKIDLSDSNKIEMLLEDTKILDDKLQEWFINNLA